MGRGVSFAELLRRHRESAGLRQEALAAVGPRGLDSRAVRRSGAAQRQAEPGDWQLEPSRFAVLAAGRAFTPEAASAEALQLALEPD